ncbi:MAG TPA: hypothetical protein VMT37_16275 [Solirubrobacterales bacterium]|nr:hypothetical protein [Solirubrobacterales bacterium]
MAIDSSKRRGGEHLREVRSERRRPAFFLQALLAEDIPPYLTDQQGAKRELPEDGIATWYLDQLDIDPAPL